MKARDSGMPDETCWQNFFDADCIVEKLECAKEKNANLAEFGSGYGTFTIPIATRTSGVVHAFDIEPELIALVQRKAQDTGLTNIQAEVRDFVVYGTGLPGETIDHSMVYNILHIEQPVQLLKEAYRILRPGGIVSIMHWIYDPSTPRGPSMSIRPRPEQCRSWAESAGFDFIRYPDLSECCKYHYGLLLMRPYANKESA
jgi:SAM-dependent methyltransferase